MSADRIVGASPAISALRDQIRHLAAFDTVGNRHVPTLLLQGETGTGKGLVARVIHDSGARRSGPFVDVNCAAIPDHLLEAELYGFEPGAFTDARRAKPGLFELASGGTLFLDEIESLPIALQGKLLRSIEDKRVRRLGALTDVAVDVKIIAAAQHRLQERVAEGCFRADLFHRLAVVVIDVPPLRDRRTDVVRIAAHFLRIYADAHGVAPKQLGSAAKVWLEAHDWPGNVRELAHLMERLTLLVPDVVVEADALRRLSLASSRPTTDARVVPPEVSAPRDEEAQIREAIARTGGNVLRAARALGLSRNALRYRMLRYGIGRETAVRTPATPDAALEARREPVWEKKPVVVLAIDLTFPKQADSTYDQPWTLSKHWEESLAEKVQGFGGALLQRSPSLFTAVFGVPHALDRMPERAVHAALAVRYMLEEPATRAIAQPELRVGIHLGDVLVDVRNDVGVGQLLPIGDTFAFPVRLLGLAAPGEIVVSAPVQRAVLRAVRLEARSAPAGSAHPEGSVFVVAGVSPAERRSPFVGRRRELGELSRALDSIRTGRGQVVALVGEAGVGKSRLALEFIETARETCRVFEVVSPPGATQAFLPMVDLLKGYFDLHVRDDDQTRRVKVTDRVLALDPRLTETLPYLFALLGIADPGSALPHMDPEPRRRRMLEVVKALLIRESLDRPVLVFVDDLHWMDEATLEFLDSLVDAIPEARLLALVAYRTGHQPRWGGRTYSAQLRLDPLDADDAAELAAQLVAEAPELKPLVLEKTQGNPFFIEEMAHALLDARSGRVDLPPTIQGVIGARVDRLATDDRTLLQILAVLGHDFSLPVVQQVADCGEAEARARLGRLQAAEFVHERPALPTSTYTFKHALTRDVVYETLTGEQRRRIHGRAVEAFERLFPDRLGDHCHALAHHARHAGLTAKAIGYLTHAGRQAVQRSAYDEAIANFRTALDLLPGLPAGRERSEQELTVQTALGAALMATQGLAAPEVEAVFTRARELCREVGESPQLFQVLQGLSVFYALRVRLRTSKELANERRRLAERLGQHALALQAQIAHGHVLLALGELPAARVELERAAGLYDPQQHHALAFGGVDPSGRDHAAIVLWLLGYPDRAQASLRQMMTIVSERPHPFTETVAQLFAAMLYQLRREPKPAREWAEAALSMTTRHAFALWRAMALVLSGWALAAQDEPAEGIDRMRRGLDAWRATGAELLRPWFLGLLADGLGTVDCAREGLTLLDEALATVDATEERWCEAELLRLRGELLVRCAAPAEAERSFAGALALARRQEAKSLELRTAISLARVWRDQQRAADAKRLLAEVHGWFVEGFETPDLEEARLIIAS